MPHPPRLPLQALSAFRTVAELSNLRAAADVLHLTHSAVSQQLRGLEEALGFPLFERRGRRIVLNDAGRRCCKQACRTPSRGSRTACRRRRRWRRATRSACA